MDKINDKMTLKQTMQTIENILPVLDGMAISIPLKRAAHFLKAFPRPCNGEKYKNCDAFDYALKVGEEYGEMMEAIMMYRHAQTIDALKSVLWESMDTITAIVSLLDKLGFNADDLAEMQMMINESNAKRDEGKRFK
jgi:hypothetical protein